MDNDINIIQAFNYNDYDSTPEKRMWIAVLTTYVDEIMYNSRKVSHDKRKKMFLKTQWMEEKTIEERIRWHETKIQDLLIESKSDDTQYICELIGIDFKWFIECLEKIASSHTKSRPPKDPRQC